MSHVPESVRYAPLGVVGTSLRRDDARIRELVARHFDFAGRMIRNVGAPESEIDDLVQQAFSITSARLDDIEIGKERAFLIQTAIRLAANARRARATTREVALDDMGDIADERPSPEELSDQRKTLRLLDRILDAMDVDLRSVFVLFEVEEMTTAEIAVVLDVPLGTVASRLRRAREDFLSRRHRLGLGRPSMGGGAR